MFNKHLTLHRFNKSLLEHFCAPSHLVEMHSIIYYIINFLLSVSCLLRFNFVECPLDLRLCKTIILSSSSSYYTFFLVLWAWIIFFKLKNFLFHATMEHVTLLPDTVVLLWFCIFCLFILLYPF